MGWVESFLNDVFGKRTRPRPKRETTAQFVTRQQWERLNALPPTTEERARNSPPGVQPVAEQRTRYRDKFELLNFSERDLLARLQEAAPNLHVFSQVSMSQIFHIISERPGGRAQLVEIGKKSVDFLLCRKTDTSIVMAIELNGPTHEREDRKRSDETKRATLEQAGIPLAVFYPGQLPDVPTLRRTIAPHIVERRKNEAERDERLGRAQHKTP